MAIMRLDLSGIGGLAPRFYGDIPFSSENFALRILGGNNQYASGVVNPISKLGYLSPATNTYVSITGGTDALMVSSVVDTVNSKGYMAENGNGWWEFSSLTDTAIEEKRTVASATMTDLEIYQVNGTRKLFYAYQKAGGGNVGTWDFSATYDDTYLSATATGGANTGAATNTRLRVADNGFMYIMDGNAVHKLDGSTSTGGASGTLTTNVLLFPSYWQITDACDLRGKMWIAVMGTTRNIISTNVGVYKDFCGIYVWNRQSTLFDGNDFLVLDGAREVRAVFPFRGVPYCFVVNSSNYVELRAYNGSQFIPLVTLAPSAYPVYPRSVSTDGNFITWAGNDGKIYKYGKPDPSIQNDALYCVGDVATDKSLTLASAGVGAIMFSGASESTDSGKNGNAEALYISTETSGGTKAVRRFYPHSLVPNTNSQTASQGNFKTLVKPLPRLANIMGVWVYFPPITGTSSSTAMTLEVYLNQSTSAAVSVNITRTEGNKGWYFLPLRKANVNFVQLGIKWDTSVNIENCITPMYADIEYLESGKNR